MKEKYHLSLPCKVLKNIYLGICISSINQPENRGGEGGANIVFAFGTRTSNWCSRGSKNTILKQ